jgi:hypothetical protein
MLQRFRALTPPNRTFSRRPFVLLAAPLVFALTLACDKKSDAPPAAASAPADEAKPAEPGALSVGFI